MKKCVKAGSLSNGTAPKRGAVVHLVDSANPYMEKAVCGATPTVQWSDADPAAEVTCPRCLKKLAR